MSEVMIFSIKAQVYILDQDLQTWSPHTFSVVPVSFYSDASAGRTRIISMENSEPKVNSLLLPEMVFHRPSDTFGQWLDPTSGDLYGLNFTSKGDAENFEKAFSENVNKAVNPVAAAAPAPAAAAAATVAPAAKPAPSSGSDDSEKLRKEIADLKKQLADKERETEKRIQEAQSNSSSSQSSLNAKIDSLNGQVKSLQSESDGYKREITSLRASSSAGQEAESKFRAAQSEVEKLKTALKQSSANVDAWQKQLAGFQKENQDLKAKIQKMIELQKGFASVLS